MKKALILLLAAVIIITAVGCGKKDSFNYEENENGITLTEYTGKEDSVEIPTKYDGKTVTAVAATAFASSEVKEISVPRGIYLNSGAFSGCITLRKVTLDKSITYVPDNCFAGCTALSEIDAPALAGCGFNAFADTALVTDSGEDFVVVGDGLLIAWTAVGNSAIVPDNVKNIGTTFSGNSNLRSVFLPDSVTEIPDSAFERCTALSDITLPAALTDIGRYAFKQCYTLTSFGVPEGCVSIGDGAFMECAMLSAVTIPDSVTTLGENVFFGAKNLVITTPFESAAFTYAAENSIKLA